MEKCKAFGLAATVNVHECEFILKEASKIFFEPYEGPVELFCPSASRIEVVVPAGNCKLIVANPLVGSAEPLGGEFRYTNMGSGTTRDLRINSLLSEIATYAVGPGTICGPLNTVFLASTYTGEITLEGFKNSGLTEQVGIFIS